MVTNRTSLTPIITAALAPIIVVLLLPASLFAQSAKSAAPDASISVPRLIKMSGVFQPADGQPLAPVEVVTLSIYTEPEGGVPVWQEMQTVVLDKAGRYTVLVGASHPDGLPPSVFGSGEAQWLSMQFARGGEVEPPRVRIASVPYAFKAQDAETLGGRPASEYLLAPTREESKSRTTRAATGDASSVATADPVAPADLVLPGTTNFLAKYVNGVDVGSSAVFESAGLVGIGTTTPLDQLHVKFTDTIGGMTGLAVQNLASTATSYSGMLFYDQLGALSQFQGFNNASHEYRINNIARTAGQFNGSINFMIGSTSRLKVGATGGTTISGAASVVAGAAATGLSVSSSGFTGALVQTTSADPNSAALDAEDAAGIGVFGFTDTGVAILGSVNNVAAAWAGFFDGDVNVTGTLFKGGGAFRIDHPLDPENKYLSHSFVESPDMKNIYDGVAIFDEAGEALVTLPDWFEALNEDFRYQLTPMGAAFVPYVADEIAGNQFKIGGGIPGRKVSWQVTGIRHDAFANAHRIQVEEPKPAAAVGTYLHPDAFGRPVQKGRPAVDDSKAIARDRAATSAAAAGSVELRARVRAISQRPTSQ